MESVSSCVHMHSSGNGDIHSESLLQCEEHNQCLSSPQDSDTSAQSYQNASVLSTTPVTAAKQHPLQCPFTSEPTGPLLVDVSPYALAETYNIAFFSKQHLLSFCIAAALAVLRCTQACCTLQMLAAKPPPPCVLHCIQLKWHSYITCSHANPCSTCISLLA